MSDYIKKEDAIKALTDCPVQYVSRICNVPNADVVEVTRCKNCRHNGSIDTDCPFGWKDKKFNMPNPNDYCSYGEKKEQEHELCNKE